MQRFCGSVVVFGRSIAMSRLHEKGQLRKHINIIIAAGSGESIEESIRVVGENLDECVHEDNFNEISLSNAKSIIKKAGEIKVTTAQKLMEIFGIDMVLTLLFF